MYKINHIKIGGFRWLNDIDLPFRPLMVLIGHHRILLFIASAFILIGLVSGCSIEEKVREAVKQEGDEIRKKIEKNIASDKAAVDKKLQDIINKAAADKAAADKKLQDIIDKATADKKKLQDIIDKADADRKKFWERVKSILTIVAITFILVVFFKMFLRHRMKVKNQKPHGPRIDKKYMDEQEENDGH